MAQKPTRGRRFERRNGIDGFSWEGIATKVDPGGNPPNRPRDAQNVRLQAGVYRSRPDFNGPATIVPSLPHYDIHVGTNAIRPYLKFTGFDHWEPHWSAEHNSVAGLRLWYGATPPLTYVPVPPGWTVTQTGAGFGFFDTDLDPFYNEVGFYQSSDSWAPAVEKYNNEVYIGDFGALRKVLLLRPSPGLMPSELLTAPADEIIASFPGFRVSAMLEHEGKLWFVLSDPSVSVNGYVYSWDGQVLTSELALTNSADQGAAMAVYKDTLCVSLAGYGELRVRSAAGVWTTKTAVGFDASPFQNSMAQYGSLLYIMDGVDSIWTFDGTNITLGHTIAATGAELGRAGADATPEFAFCCALLAGRLYYGWTDGETGHVLVGYVDADNETAYRYTDVGVFNIEDSLGYRITDGDGVVIATFGAMTALAQYRGRLWAAIGEYPEGNSKIFTHSQQYVPYNGWFEAGVDNGPEFMPTVGSGLGGAGQIFYLRTI